MRVPVKAALFSYQQIYPKKAPQPFMYFQSSRSSSVMYFEGSLPANEVSIALLLLIQGFEMLLNHQIDSTRRGIRKEVLEFLDIHREMSLDAR
jgi:hypothetical protein